MARAPPWIAVPLAAVVLLWVSDRGQHRWLVERFRRLAPGYILSLSIGAALLLNSSQQRPRTRLVQWPGGCGWVS